MIFQGSKSPLKCIWGLSRAGVDVSTQSDDCTSQRHSCAEPKVTSAHKVSLFCSGRTTCLKISSISPHSSPLASNAKKAETPSGLHPRGISIAQIWPIVNSWRTLIRIRKWNPQLAWINFCGTCMQLILHLSTKICSDTKDETLVIWNTYRHQSTVQHRRELWQEVDKKGEWIDDSLIFWN